MSLKEKALHFAMGAGYSLMQTMTPPTLDHDPEREEALWKLAAQAGEKGWTLAALRDVAGCDADLLFPGGPAEMVEAWADLVDREMVRRAQRVFDEGAYPRLSERVRHCVLERLDILEPFRAAERRACGIALSPCSGTASGRMLARTVDSIWRAAEDTSGGVTWVTKRVSLATVYVPTFLAWLGGSDRRVVEQVLDAGLARARAVGMVRKRVEQFSPFHRAA